MVVIVVIVVNRSSCFERPQPTTNLLKRLNGCKHTQPTHSDAHLMHEANQALSVNSCDEMICTLGSSDLICLLRLSSSSVPSPSQITWYVNSWGRKEGEGSVCTWGGGGGRKGGGSRVLMIIPINSPQSFSIRDVSGW